MTKEEALQIDEWMYGEKKQYGISYPISKIQEAHAILFKKLPDWIQDILSFNEKDEHYSELVYSVTKALFEKREKMINNIFGVTK